MCIPTSRFVCVFYILRQFIIGEEINIFAIASIGIVCYIDVHENQK